VKCLGGTTLGPQQWKGLMVAAGSGSKDNIHIISLVPLVGVWSPPWSGVPGRKETPQILALSNPTGSEHSSHHSSHQNSCLQVTEGQQPAASGTSHCGAVQSPLGFCFIFLQGFLCQ